MLMKTFFFSELQLKIKIVNMHLLNEFSYIYKHICANENILFFLEIVYGVRTHPENKFIWNQHLLRKCDKVHKDWLILVIHGFVEQKSECVYKIIKQITVYC